MIYTNYRRLPDGWIITNEEDVNVLARLRDDGDFYPGFIKLMLKYNIDISCYHGRTGLKRGRKRSSKLAVVTPRGEYYTSSVVAAKLLQITPQAIYQRFKNRGPNYKWREATVQEYNQYHQRAVSAGGMIVMDRLAAG